MKNKIRAVCSLLLIGVATSSPLLAALNGAAAPRVPESGSSVLLLGAAMVGLLMVVRRFKK